MKTKENTGRQMIKHHEKTAVSRTNHYVMLTVCSCSVSVDKELYGYCIEIAVLEM